MKITLSLVLIGLGAWLAKQIKSKGKPNNLEVFILLGAVACLFLGFIYFCAGLFDLIRFGL